MASAIAPEYEVSQAGVADAAEIAAFCWSAWNAVDHDGADFVALSDDWVRDIASVDHLTERLSSDCTPVLVARAAEAVVGVAAAHLQEDGTFEITQMLVHPLVEHTGVGSMLLEASVAHARRCKAERIRSHAESEEARDFFAHRGFVPSGDHRLELKLRR